MKIFQHVKNISPLLIWSCKVTVKPCIVIHTTLLPILNFSQRSRHLHAQKWKDRCIPGITSNNDVGIWHYRTCIAFMRIFRIALFIKCRDLRLFQFACLPLSAPDRWGGYDWMATLCEWARIILYAPSQRETTLQCNLGSHSLRAYTKWTLSRPWRTDNSSTPTWFVFRLLSTRWRHQMETFFALLALCGANSPVTGEFPSQKPVTRSFYIFYGLRLDKWLNKPSRHQWFETPSRSLWRPCYDIIVWIWWRCCRHFHIHFAVRAHLYIDSNRQATISTNDGKVLYTIYESQSFNEVSCSRNAWTLHLTWIYRNNRVC